MAGRSRLIDAAPGPALRFRAAASEYPLAFEALQRRIDLAQLGGPEIVQPLVENSFQVVPAGGFPEQSQQDVFEAHAATV